MADKHTEKLQSAVSSILKHVASGDVELVAEPQLTGYPFAEVEGANYSADKAYFSIYCKNPSLLHLFERSGSSDLQIASEIGKKSTFELNGETITRYKLHGTIKNALLAGVTLAKGKGQKEFVQIKDIKHGDEHAIALVRDHDEANAVKLDQNPFGAERTLRIPSIGSRPVEVALAKAEEHNGMRDLLLVRTSNSRDSALDMLSDLGLYGDGDKETGRRADDVWQKKNRQSAGQVTAVYIPKALADSIRNANENDVIDFNFDSPDIEEFAEKLDEDPTAIAEETGMGDDVIDFLGDDAPADVVCELAAHYWPEQELEQELESRPSKPAGQAEEEVEQPKPLAEVVASLGLTANHYQVEHIRRSNGEYRYRVRFNKEAGSEINPKDWWAISDPRRCSEPLKVERINFRRSQPESLDIELGSNNEVDVRREISRLNKALGGSVEEPYKPFQIHTRGLRLKREKIDGKTSNQRFPIKQVWLGSADEHGVNNHYLYLSAPSAGRLHESMLLDLGFVRENEYEIITGEKEYPAVARIKLEGNVYGDLVHQFKAALDDKSKLSEYFDTDYVQSELIPELEHAGSLAELDKTVRESEEVEYRETKMAETTKATAKKEKKKGPGPTPAKKRKDRESLSPLERSIRAINSNPAANIVLTYAQEPDEAEVDDAGNPVTYKRMYIIGSQSSQFSPLTQLLGSKERGEDSVDKDDMELLQVNQLDDKTFGDYKGIFKGNSVLCVYDVPDDLFEALATGGRDIKVLKDEDHPFENEADILPHVLERFKKSRTQTAPQREERSAEEKLASLPIQKLKVRFPDQETWAHYSQQMEGVIGQMERWRSTKMVNDAAVEMAATYEQQLASVSTDGRRRVRGGNQHVTESLSTIGATLRRGVEEVRSGAKEVASGLSAVDKAREEHQKISDWMSTSLDENHTTTALVIKSVGQENAQKVIQVLETQGKLARPSTQIEYSEAKRGKRKKNGRRRSDKLEKRTAYVIYPTAEFLQEIEEIHHDHKDENISEFTLPIQYPSLDDNQPLVDIETLGDVVRKRYDVQEIRQRIQQEARPLEMLSNVTDYLGQSMKTKSLLLRERQENPVDEKGIGVESKDKGSQWVVVCAVDRHNLKDFTNHVWTQLKDAQLIDGQKIYSHVSAGQKRKLAPYQTMKSKLDSFMDYHDNFNFMARDSYDGFNIESYLQELRGAIASVDASQLTMPDKPLNQWDAEDMMQMPAELAPAILLHQSLKESGALQTLGQEPVNVEAFLPAFRESWNMFRQSRRRIAMHIDDLEMDLGVYDESVQAQPVKAHKRETAIYTLDGTAMNEDELAQHISQDGTVYVKCYLSTDASQLARQATAGKKKTPNPLLKLEKDQHTAIPASISRAEVEVQGKHTAAVSEERRNMNMHNFKDMIAPERSALTSEQIETIVPGYFEARQRGQSAA